MIVSELFSISWRASLAHHVHVDLVCYDRDPELVDHFQDVQQVLLGVDRATRIARVVDHDGCHLLTSCTQLLLQVAQINLPLFLWLEM